MTMASQEEMDKQQKAAEMEADKMRKDMDRLRLHMSKLQDEAKESAKSAESARVRALMASFPRLHCFLSCPMAAGAYL